MAASETALRLARLAYPGVPASTLQRLFRQRLVRAVVEAGRPARRVGLKDLLPPSARLVLPAPVLAAAAARETEGRAKTAAPPDAVARRAAERLKARVLLRDGGLLVLDKPRGMCVQGGPGVGRVHVAGLAASLAPGARLAHRLDKGASGVLALGVGAAATAALASSFARHDAKKTYWALVEGAPPAPEGTVRAPLAVGDGVGDDKEQEAMVLARRGAPGALEAETRYRVIGAASDGAASHTWLELSPVTGRKHQLRAHCALALNAPIVGDYKYGYEGRHAKRLGGSPRHVPLHLHARRLVLPHPTRPDETVDVAAPAPPHLRRSLAAVGLGEALRAREADEW